MADIIKEAEDLPPKDLGLVMGTKDQVVWEEVCKQCRIAITGCEKEILIQKAVLMMAREKVAIEKAKFK